jgi:uncharacterized protein (TIGR03118 family)
MLPDFQRDLAMGSLLRIGQASSQARRVAPRRSRHSVLEWLDRRCLLAGGVAYVQSALVSDLSGVAPHTNADLINPWTVVEMAQGQFEVAANGSGKALAIAANGQVLGQPIVILPPPGSPPGTTAAPTGAVLNTSSGFQIRHNGRSAPATLIFSTEDGTIAAWNPRIDRAEALIANDQSPNNAVYKSLAMGQVHGALHLYATDFHNGKIDVFDKNFHLVHLSGSFTDPNTPAGFAPFGIKRIHDALFVSYAMQNGERHDDVAGPGHGFIDEFDLNGHFLGRFATGTAAGGTLTELNSPFGMTVAPDHFGPFSHALLVGNFGDSHVSAFNLNTGAFLGQLSGPSGQPLSLDGGVGNDNAKGLWGITFGNGHNGAAANTLYFASGVHDEQDGVFGKVTPVHVHS